MKTALKVLGALAAAFALYHLEELFFGDDEETDEPAKTDTQES